ncbi:MAG: saccharopine dehydrogenase C-terminal domain-containing protein [Planctomycetota bacterium]
MKRILVLGAGLVSRPLVRYLLDKEFDVRVASRTVSKAEALIEGHPRGRAVAADMTDPGPIESLVAEADVVISLLPASFHVTVARMCLNHGKNMVTTSYVSDAMSGLNAEAEGKGLLLLNEIGVDPGIDHMSAMRVIHTVQEAGGKVVGFRSYCGGLPAPEADTNPLGYKFSWNPRGVLTAAVAPAKYLEEGALKEVAGRDVLKTVHSLDVESLGTFEAYPNRDSLGYKTLYGLTDARTLFRGTLRNRGHCDSWSRWIRFGLFDQTPRDDLAGRAYRDVLADLAGAGADADPREALARALGTAVDDPAVSKLEWLGLLSDLPVPEGTPTLLDLLGGRMRETMGFEPGERDMLVLIHKFEAEYSSGKKERITSSLIDFGIQGGDSSMARTVSLPAAVAARMVAEGTIPERGVRIPVAPSIYRPVLDELAALGIDCKEVVEEVG